MKTSSFFVVLFLVTCASLSSVVASRKNIVVVARHVEDIGWIDLLRKDKSIEALVYQSSNESEHLFVPNRGAEASKYLTAMVDLYNESFDHVLFLHGHRYAPHNIACTTPWCRKKYEDKSCRRGAEQIANHWDFTYHTFRHAPGYRIGRLNCRSRASRKVKHLLGKAGVHWPVPPPCSQVSMLNAQFGMPKHVLRSIPLHGLKSLLRYVLRSSTYEIGLERAFELEVSWKYLFVGLSNVTSRERNNAFCNARSLAS